MAQQPTVSKTERVQTAVEWLIENLPQRFSNALKNECTDIIEQAKQMEKRQMLDAIVNNQNGLLRRKTILEAEQYYKETYEMD